MFLKSFTRLNFSFCSSRSPALQELLPESISLEKLESQSIIARLHPKRISSYNNSQRVQTFELVTSILSASHLSPYLEAKLFPNFTFTFKTHLTQVLDQLRNKIDSACRESELSVPDLLKYFKGLGHCEMISQAGIQLLIKRCSESKQAMEQLGLKSLYLLVRSLSNINSYDTIGIYQFIIQICKHVDTSELQQLPASINANLLYYLSHLQLHKRSANKRLPPLIATIIDQLLSRIQQISSQVSYINIYKAFLTLPMFFPKKLLMELYERQVRLMINKQFVPSLWFMKAFMQTFPKYLVQKDESIRRLVFETLLQRIHFEKHNLKLLGQLCQLVITFQFFDKQHNEKLFKHIIAVTKLNLQFSKFALQDNSNHSKQQIIAKIAKFICVLQPNLFQSLASQYKQREWKGNFVTRLLILSCFLRCNWNTRKLMNGLVEDIRRAKGQKIITLALQFNQIISFKNKETLFLFSQIKNVLQSSIDTLPRARLAEVVFVIISSHQKGVWLNAFLHPISQLPLKTLFQIMKKINKNNRNINLIIYIFKVLSIHQQVFLPDLFSIIRQLSVYKILTVMDWHSFQQFTSFISRLKQYPPQLYFQISWTQLDFIVDMLPNLTPDSAWLPKKLWHKETRDHNDCLLSVDIFINSKSFKEFLQGENQKILKERFERSKFAISSDNIVQRLKLIRSANRLQALGVSWLSKEEWREVFKNLPEIHYQKYEEELLVQQLIIQQILPQHGFFEINPLQKIASIIQFKHAPIVQSTLNRIIIRLSAIPQPYSKKIYCKLCLCLRPFLQKKQSKVSYNILSLSMRIFLQGRQELQFFWSYMEKVFESNNMNEMDKLIVVINSSQNSSLMPLWLIQKFTQILSNQKYFPFRFTSRIFIFYSNLPAQLRPLTLLRKVLHDIIQSKSLKRALDDEQLPGLLQKLELTDCDLYKMMAKKRGKI